MTATFWSNFSKRNNSTKQPSGSGTAYTVYLKDNVSVLAPVFRIEGIDLTVTYCQWNGRYYFVRDIVLSNNAIYEVHCEIDPMATWKSAIGSSSQYVLRSASQSDGTIVDMFYPTKKDPLFAVKDSSLTPVSWATSINSGCYIVGIISGDPAASGTINQGAVKYYCFEPSAFIDFSTQLFTEANYTSFQTSDRYTFNPIQYISSVQWFPFKPSGTSYSSLFVKVGWTSIPAMFMEKMSTGIGEYTYQFGFDRHPQAASRGQYLNSAPFTDYLLVFPPFGEMQLDGEICAQAQFVNVIMKVDFITGRGLLIGRSSIIDSGVTKIYEHFRREVQFGVNIQIAQIASNQLGVQQQILGAYGAAMGNLLSGNIIGAITGTASGIISAAQTSAPRAQVSGSNDSLVNFVGNSALIAPHLYEVFHQIVDEDNADCGRPLCQKKTISSLSGYILCANAEIAIAGLPSERDQIVAYMDGGFFYE